MLGPDADEGARVAEALPAHGLVGGRGVGVDGEVSLARLGLHALQDAAGELLVGVADAQLRALLVALVVAPPAALHDVVLLLARAVGLHAVLWGGEGGG